MAQSVDYTAFVLLEWTERQGEWDAARFAWRKTKGLRVRYLSRAPKGTPYTVVVERVRELVQRPEVAGRCQLLVDATGVGQAVVDMLEQARLGCPIKKVKITAGDAERYGDGCYRVPKRDLIARVQVLLQQGGLEIGNTVPLGEILVREMTEMRVKVLPSGYEQAAAWREGEHDDLVLALALACWGAAKAGPTGDAGYWQRKGVEFYGKGRIV